MNDSERDISSVSSLVIVVVRRDISSIREMMNNCSSSVCVPQVVVSEAAVSSSVQSETVHIVLSSVIEFPVNMAQICRKIRMKSIAVTCVQFGTLPHCVADVSVQRNPELFGIAYYGAAYDLVLSQYSKIYSTKVMPGCFEYKITKTFNYHYSMMSLHEN